MISLCKLVVVTTAIAIMLTVAPVAADWNAGLELFGQERFAEAVEHFQGVIKSNPNWPGAYLMLGRCQLALKQPDEALHNLRKAVELGPDDPSNVAALSRALIDQGLNTETIELLEGVDLKNLNPAWRVEMERMLASCLLAEYRTDDAVALLESGLAEAPDSAALHRAIAGAYQAVGNRPAAFDHLAQAFTLDPDDHASGRSAVKTALALAGATADDETAESLRMRAVELATALATAAPEYEHLLLAGEADLAARQLGAAADWFVAAVSKRPQEPLARFYLGRTLAALDRNDEAITHLRAGLGCAPDDELEVRIHGQLGRLLACRLELSEAARHYQAAGDAGHAQRINELAADFADALTRLAALRGDSAELAGMEAELEKLGDNNGVTAVAGQREIRDREIAGIEANLTDVRVALCQ